jgi:hypothetical protein
LLVIGRSGVRGDVDPPLLALAVGVALLVANRLIPGPETVAIVVYFVAVAMTARAMTATRATTTPLEIPIVYAAAPSSLPITA